jgi:hypothetical protein
VDSAAQHQLQLCSVPFGGLGWQHLFYEQGIQHVLLIIKHLRTPGPFHSLLHVNLQWYQVVRRIVCTTCIPTRTAAPPGRCMVLLYLPVPEALLSTVDDPQNITAYTETS